MDQEIDADVALLETASSEQSQNMVVGLGGSTAAPSPKCSAPEMGPEPDAESDLTQPVHSTTFQQEVDWSADNAAAETEGQSLMMITQMITQRRPRYNPAPRVDDKRRGQSYSGKQN